ncbi:MAG TPA: glycosyltransferase family 4 protein [Pyrinomonadaceae bacterium]|nr:glycosyltransferase family 4 protein [Pyrinomonadaceae bacterium]
MFDRPNGNRAVVSVAMLGARMHFAVPRIFAEAGILHTFYTDFYVGNKKVLNRLVDLVPSDVMPTSWNRLTGRIGEGIPQERVISFDSLGFWYYFKRRRQQIPSGLPTLFADVNQRFGNRVVRSGLNGSKLIWGFNRASLEIFRHARERGIRCILEQSTAPRKLELTLMNQEIQRWPNWADEKSPQGMDPLIERERAEWEFADQIVCPSDFVARALQAEGVCGEKVAVVPYGVDTWYFDPPASRSKQTFNVLFMGEVGLQKGVLYLLEALRSLNRQRSIRAKLVGPIALERERLSEYRNWCEISGSVPRGAVRALYHWADVLVLPSVCEGSATVTYEAMACGLPIITTANSGSLVRDGIDGFVVPVCDSAELRARITLLCDDEQLRSQMSAAANQRTNEISLEAYGQRLLRTLSVLTD